MESRGGDTRRNKTRLHHDFRSAGRFRQQTAADGAHLAGFTRERSLVRSQVRPSAKLLHGGSFLPRLRLHLFRLLWHARFFGATADRCLRNRSWVRFPGEGGQSPVSPRSAAVMACESWSLLGLPCEPCGTSSARPCATATTSRAVGGRCGDGCETRDRRADVRYQRCPLLDAVRSGRARLWAY